MAKEINALDMRKRFGQIMDEVRYRKEPYIVKKNGRAVIVLLDIDVYKASKSQLEEEVFIEDYSRERMTEFLEEDKMDQATRTKVQKSLDR